MSLLLVSILVALFAAAPVAGQAHSSLEGPGTLYALGANSHGQLGTGDTTPSLTPVRVAEGVIACAAGGAHSLYLTEAGTLYGVGMNEGSQLGGIPSLPKFTPVVIETGVSRIAAGNQCSFFIKDGTLYALGYSPTGGLGLGPGVVQAMTPTAVASEVVDVAANGSLLLFLTADGTAYGAGSNSAGALTGTDSFVYEPRALLTHVRSIAIGGEHSLFVTHDNVLYGAGRNSAGELGVDSLQNVSTITEVARDVDRAAGGLSYTLFIDTSGQLYGLGGNNWYQIGQNERLNYPDPAFIDRDVVAIPSNGANFAFYLNDEGTLFGMGDNRYGTLGLGHEDSPVQRTPIETEIAALSSGNRHTLFIKAASVIPEFFGQPILSYAAVYEFPVLAEGPWVITSPADWLACNPVSGTGPGVVRMSVAEYSVRTEPRSATLEIAGERFLLTQLPQTDFDLWLAGYLEPVERGNRRLGGRDGDFDRDHVSNYFEYLTGGNPADRQSTTVIGVSVESFFQLQPKLIIDPAPEGVTVKVEYSVDLATWTDVGPARLETVENRLEVDLSGLPEKALYRVVLE